jgi:hypothetical protein
MQQQQQAATPTMHVGCGTTVAAPMMQENGVVGWLNPVNFPVNSTVLIGFGVAT